VRSAAPLSEEELNTLVDAFSPHHSDVLPTIELDPELLGPESWWEIEGRVYDASLKTHTATLRRDLSPANVREALSVSP